MPASILKNLNVPVGTPSLDLPVIGILSDKFYKGADTPSDSVPPLSIVDLAEAFAHEWPTDAHFCLYRTEPLQEYPRCTKILLPALRTGGVDLVQTCIVLDWDCPDHARWGESPVSVSDFLDLLQGLAEKLPWVWDWAAIYTTRAGARIVYVLDYPLPVDDAELRTIWVCEQFRSHGVMVDVLADWTRLFRLPRVTRENSVSAEDPHFLFLDQYDRRLKTSLLQRGERTAAARKINLTRPAEDDAKLLIESINMATGRMKMSDWYVKAKRLLSGKACYPCLFEYTPMAEKGERDQTLMRYIGQAIAVLKNIESTTPQHVYALFIDTCRQLGTDEDWLTLAWDKIARVWEVEEAKAESERVEKAQHTQVQLSRFEQIHKGMLEWCGAMELRSNDPQTVRDFIDRHLIVSLADNFLLMGPDGYYEPMQLRPGQVIPSMRKRNGLEALIPTKAADEKGIYRDRQLTNIVNEHATIVSRARGIPSITPGATIEHLDHSDATIVIPCYCRNPLLEPEYDEDVDEWLYHLFQGNYAAGCDWIRWAVAWDEGPICALSIKGSAGVGKKLLVQGLAETLRRPSLAGAQDLVSEHQYGLLESPFLVVNEGWPISRGGMHPADQFRALVGGDPIRCARKYLAPVELRSPVRIIFTANNIDVIRMLTGNRDLSPEDREALAVRLLHFDVGDHAAHWFREKGGIKFTGSQGRRWICGDGGQPSDFIVARHFLWLWAQRPEEAPGKRFLVEGGNSEEVIFEMRTQSGSAPLVIEALIEMLNARVIGPDKGLSIGIGECPQKEKGRLYVLTAEVLNHYRKYMYERVHQKMTAEQVTSVFRGLLVQGARNGQYVLESRRTFGSKRWYELDPRLLLEVARKDGWKCDVLEMLALDEEKASLMRASETREKTLLDRIVGQGTLVE